jgi:hypothetical protein
MSDSDFQLDTAIDDGCQRNIAFKANERDELDQAISAFLNSGGNIKEVNAGERKDPPKKPESKYGDRPI